MHNRLEDYIASLSGREREQYKDLIEDSLRRHRETKENINRLREDLVALSASWDKLQEKTELLLESISRLNSGIADLYLLTQSEEFASIAESAPGCYPASMN